MSLCGICSGGSVGGDKLCVPPPQTDPAYVQHCHRNAVPSQQHDEPGHICGVPHQHAGLDDPLAGAQQGQCAAPGIHTGQCGYGYHDSHEYCPLLSAAQERLFEEQQSGEQEGEGDVKEQAEGDTEDYDHKHTHYCILLLCG